MKRSSLFIPAVALGVGLLLGGSHAAAEPSGVACRHGNFGVCFERGAITSLKRVGDTQATDYLRAGGRFGDLTVRWRADHAPWQTIATQDLPVNAAVSLVNPPENFAHGTQWSPPTGPRIENRFTFEGDALVWSMTLSNPGNHPLEIGDLAFACPMNTKYEWDRDVTYHQRVIRHSLISGHGSFMFWTRCDAEGPYLLMTPLPNTSLEYFDAPPSPGQLTDNFTAYIHSAAQSDVLREHATHWRQANTSATLAPAGQPGNSVTYGFRLSWVQDYAALRQRIVDDGLFDVRVAPGMTLPVDLTARIAIKSHCRILALDAEFPEATDVRDLGTRDDGTRLYEVGFRKLGENRLTLRAEDGRHMVLEFFSTEPLETLIHKRAAFLSRSQHRDPAKWYNGLISDWNMADGVLVSPDNLDTIPESRRYAVSCDDPGLCKAPFLAAKNVEYPDRGKIEALEYYVEHFLWGGLQMTDAESHPFGLYGIDDWKRNRESPDPGTKGRTHLWRIYDYPHVVMLYLQLHRIAREHPDIPTRISAAEYLRRAHGTAMALFTYPMELARWSPCETGLYNELVIEEVIQELERAGQTRQAGELRQHWQRKVAFFVSGKANLFASEYPFDTTGFESTHAFARYVLRGEDQAGGSAAVRVDALRFAHQQAALNVGCRGWLETAYYLYGSDYRGGGNGHYTLSYMSQMGGWSLLDYTLHDAVDPQRLLPLAYGSILSSWALLNSGTAQSNYGYWYPGVANDGGASGGFEPAPYGKTWLGQPHHRGAWSYGCEIDLGFSGALRASATIFADDPLFGPIAYGGTCLRDDRSWQVWCKDGVRRRFHILRKDQRVHLQLDRDHIAADVPLRFDDALSTLSFTLESPDPQPRATTLRLAGLPTGDYTIALDGQAAGLCHQQGDVEARVELKPTRSRHVVTIAITRSQTK
ncbi:MAG: DUF5695 domain-containing protein [Verrucomicrobiota bacterium]